MARPGAEGDEGRTMSGAGTERRGRRATIRDVARLAGVSVGTVSHVLNTSKSVSQAAREAVLEAVEALNYRPNSLARSLIAHRPRSQGRNHADRPRLIAVGYLSIDYMVRIDRVPGRGERTTSRAIEKMLGGPAANVAAFAAGLGPPFDLSVEIVTQFGSDADSLWALEELERRDIDASGAQQQPGGRLSRCMVLVEEDGQRTIINEPLQVPGEFLARTLTGRTSGDLPVCVHFDGFHLAAAERVHKALRAEGYLLSLHSAGLAPGGQTIAGMARLLGMFDLLFLDGDAFARICRTAPGLAEQPECVFDHAQDLQCRAVLLTRGAEGAVLLRPGRAPVRVAAPAVEVVDATGAGDAFAGLFLGSWLSQGDLDAALAHAVRGASLSLTALGAQGRLVRAEDVTGALQGAELGDA